MHRTYNIFKMCKADAVLKICELIKCVLTGDELKFKTQEFEESCRIWKDYLYVRKWLKIFIKS